MEKYLNPVFARLGGHPLPVSGFAFFAAFLLRESRRPNLTGAITHLASYGSVLYRVRVSNAPRGGGGVKTQILPRGQQNLVGSSIFPLLLFRNGDLQEEMGFQGT